MGVSGPDDWTLVEPFKGPEMKYRSDETHWSVAIARMTSQLSGKGSLHIEILYFRVTVETLLLVFQAFFILF